MNKRGVELIVGAFLFSFLVKSAWSVHARELEENDFGPAVWLRFGGLSRWDFGGSMEIAVQYE